ncbi:hypothetical protein AAFN85_10780 [Mucilaginibacter sp. CAU 1740]|uniref:hypothetical protein n=1 Tax=Mucilaginibacter sp. CAU 1740 TaxID=3140365 RepID=UPI00325A5088
MIKNYIPCLIIVLLALGCTKKVPPYTISRVTKTDTATKLTVNITGRLKWAELLSITSKIKADSANLPNLQLDFMLPGHNDKSTGANNFYAIARYPKTDQVTMQDTTKDADGTTVRLNIIGLSSEKVKHLLSLNPEDLKGKNIIGRFIDDNNHTLIVPFTDIADGKKETYIIELDTLGNVVSRTIPKVDSSDGVEKLHVTERGDYITIKDSVLTQYSIDDLGLPYNSTKAGI